MDKTMAFALGIALGVFVMAYGGPRTTIEVRQSPPSTECLTCADTMHSIGTPYRSWRGMNEVCVVRWHNRYEEVPMHLCPDFAAAEGEP